MEKSNLKIWILAARPKTLAASLSPVVATTGLTLRDGVFDLWLTVVCLLFAVLLQITANFANDYFDFRKGSDTADRIGPKRAVAEGWITPRQMLTATLITLAVACCLGAVMMWLVDWKLIFAGIAIGVFALAYSGGKYPLAYHGWGDVCVFVFFGIVPVLLTYYVQALTVNPETIICGAAVGLVTINILVANNYRDYSTDKNTGKNTSIVIFGKRFGRRFYLFNGIAAAVLCQYFWFVNAWFAALLPLAYLFLHIRAWRRMIEIEEGAGLIAVLEMSAKNALIFSLLLFAGLLLGINY
jgi:1,4-dihydroxy-2-naphthoate octaprenyltransferase